MSQARMMIKSLYAMSRYCAYSSSRRSIPTVTKHVNTAGIESQIWNGWIRNYSKSPLVDEKLEEYIKKGDLKKSLEVLDERADHVALEDAYKVFNAMPNQEVRYWETMIGWLAMKGNGEEAIDLFMEFKKCGLKPDNQIFHAVFRACSVVADMREGLLHFESMTKMYNLVLSIDDYARVVDMLGSSGYVQDALEFIEKMPIKPNVEIWAILMRHSWAHGDLDIGDRCAEIVNLEDPARLDEQSKKGLMPKEKEKNISKSSRWDHGSHHEYKAGDTSHPQHLMIQGLLRGIHQSMFDVGYVFHTRDVLWDVDRVDKEEHLLVHSERLAAAEGLLKTPARTTITILKDLRCCYDCHDALKFMSKLTGRRIVSRDGKIFHHFEDGKCSCNDYW